jgi:hypothetical protein
MATTDALMKVLSIVEKLIDVAPQAFQTIKELKSEAHAIIKEEPALAAPEVKTALGGLIDKAATAIPPEEKKT